MTSLDKNSITQIQQYVEEQFEKSVIPGLKGFESCSYCFKTFRLYFNPKYFSIV